jgi:hypothetical protein
MTSVKGPSFSSRQHAPYADACSEREPSFESIRLLTSLNGEKVIDEFEKSGPLN